MIGFLPFNGQRKFTVRNRVECGALAWRIRRRARSRRNA